jgi:hypothetical protein
MLHPAIVIAAGIFLRELNGTVIAKPANMLEWPPGGFLHGLYPAAQGCGIGWVFLCYYRTGNQ